MIENKTAKFHTKILRGCLKIVKIRHGVTFLPQPLHLEP